MVAANAVQAVWNFVTAPSSSSSSSRMLPMVIFHQYGSLLIWKKPDFTV